MEEEKNKLIEMEQDLSDLESYINDMWEFLPVPIAYVNPRGIIMDADSAFERLVKCPKEQIIGKFLKDFCLQGEKMEELQKITIEQGTVKNKEYLIINKKDEEKAVNAFTLARKENNKVIGFFLGFIDLSEQKKIEKELQTKNIELEKFNKLMIGRELKMIELKKKIKNLEKKLKQYKS